VLWREPSLSPIVLGFTTAVSIATGLIFGLAPALTTVRSIPQDHLREGGGHEHAGGAASATRTRLRAGGARFGAVGWRGRQATKVSPIEALKS